MSSDKNYQGTDVNLEISLEEYGFVARPITVDYADEYFVIYKMDDNQYGSGHIRESELDAIVNGTEWASEEDVNSMLETVGASKQEWMDLPFTSKFSDLVSYWGTENIMGTDYYPNDKNWAFEEIGLESDDNDNDDLVEYIVPTHYVTALLNSDSSGLSFEDIEELAEFVDEVKDANGNANFMLGNDEESYFANRNDINALGSDVMKLYIRPSDDDNDDDEFAKGGGVNNDEDKELLDDLRRYIYEHRHTKGITAEIIDKTKKGFKVKQIDEYGWGNEKKKTPRTTTAFYTEKEFSDLFKIKWLKDGYSDGGAVLTRGVFFIVDKDGVPSGYEKGYMEAFSTDNLLRHQDDWDGDVSDYDVVSESLLLKNNYNIEDVNGVVYYDESKKENIVFGDELKEPYSSFYLNQLNKENQFANGGGVGEKVYNEQFGIGKSKYVVNFYDGVKTHNDGSAFFDIRIFKNIPDKNKFINELKSKGYVMKYADGGGVDGWEDLSNVKPNRIEVSETLAFGNPDKLILKYDGKKIAEFYFNMRGYNAGFGLKNSEGVHYGFGGDKSKSRQISDFKKAIKDGFTFVKKYEYADGGGVDNALNKNKIFNEFMLEWMIPNKESNTLISKSLKELIEYVSNNNIKNYTIKGWGNNKWETLISPNNSFENGGGVDGVLKFTYNKEDFEIKYPNGDEWSNNGMVNFETGVTGGTWWALRITKHFPPARKNSFSVSINNASELSKSELTKLVSEKIKELNEEFNDYKRGYSYSNGGGVDDADWIEESLIDLQNETGFDDLVVSGVNPPNHYLVMNDNDIMFEVFKTEDDAREFAIEDVKDGLELVPEEFNKEWLMNFAGEEDFFKPFFEGWNENYVNDIENEDSNEYPNRLIEEMVDNGIVSSEEAKEDGFNAEDYKEDLVNLLTKNQIEEGNGGLKHYIDNFGIEDAFQVIVENQLIDINKASKNAVDTDGIAHFLSAYDGKQIELSNGQVAYRVN